MYIDNHKSWKFISLFNLIIISILIIIYSSIYYYFIIYNRTDVGIALIILKPLPLFNLCIQMVWYYFIYGLHVHSLLLGIGFMLCLFGDIFMSLINKYCGDTGTCIYFIIGGSSFFFARIFIIASLAYNNSNENRYEGNRTDSKNNDTVNKKMMYKFAKITGSIITNAIFIVLFSYYLFRINPDHSADMSRLFTFLYIVVMGINNHFAIIRLGRNDDEYVLVIIINLIGTLLFCFSDIMLLLKTSGIVGFPENLQVWYDMASLILYWVGMYMICISLVRKKDNTTINLDCINDFDSF